MAAYDANSPSLLVFAKAGDKKKESPRGMSLFACMDSRLEVLEYVYSRIVLIKILASNNYLSKKFLLYEYEYNTNIRTSRLNNQLLHSSSSRRIALLDPRCNMHITYYSIQAKSTVLDNITTSS